MNQLRFLLIQLGRHKFSYFAGVSFIFATNWMAVSIPSYLQQAVDLLSLGSEAIGSRRSELGVALMMILAFAGGVVVVRTLSRVMFFNPGRTIEYEVKNQLFDQLTHLEKDYYDKNQIGNIVSRLQNDITGLRLLCGFGAMQFFNIISALSLTPYMMWKLSPELTLYCVVPVLLVFGLVRFGMRFIVTHSRLLQAQLQEISGFIVSSLSGVDVLKGFSLEGWSNKSFRQINQRMLNESLSISFIRSFLMPILNNLEHILKVLILMVGGVYVIEGSFSIGELTEFIAYAALLTTPIMGLGWLSTLFQQSMVGVESIQTILSQETPKKHLPRLAAQEGKSLFEKGLKVEGLAYQYDDGEHPVLEHISFEVLPHRTLGILGKIGSGKSTLVNCLNGYLQPPPGTIFVGGRDITEMNPKDLREQIRTVSQDVFLFSETVRNNILFGGQEPPTSEELLTLIDKAALSDEVARFPQGLETLVGERGIMLSGGQKQRISLARAMAQPCGLLILDNVLSAVDYETERFLLGQILKRESARSLLIVSHRVRALEQADEILVLDQGKIVQRGRHEDLLAEPGIYFETWELQNQGDHG
ncbi:MAG: ABC transporter ATP-binding protein [bacterium]|nr:ABC transporter ATP-binding protein [bacterium]